jgi:hypothetical protein
LPGGFYNILEYSLELLRVLGIRQLKSDSGAEFAAINLFKNLAF